MKDIQKGERQDIHNLFDYSSERRSTDPRDMFFALLGLAYPPCAVRADYTLDLDTIGRMIVKSREFPRLTHLQLLALSQAEVH